MIRFLKALICLLPLTILVSPAEAQTWFVNDSNRVLRVPISNVALTNQTADFLEFTISEQTLIIALAETLNATRIPEFNECQERISGSWSIPANDEPVLSFSALFELWNCTYIDVPEFKGLVVRMERKEIKNKLYHGEAEALYQVKFSISGDTLIAELIQFRSSNRDLNINMFEALRSITKKIIIFQSVELSSAEGTSSNPLSGKKIDIESLNNTNINIDGDLVFHVPR